MAADKGKQGHVPLPDLPILTQDEQIASLEAQLSEARSAQAMLQAQVDAASAYTIPSGVEEVPTGKTMKVRKFKEYDIKGYKDSGEPIVTPIFETVDVPEYVYQINMAPCGGTDLKINGVAYFHGAIVKTDIDTIRLLKDMVYKTWKHDADIHGTDENFYR